jgi:hypothetical protein
MYVAAMSGTTLVGWQFLRGFVREFIASFKASFDKSKSP